MFKKIQIVGNLGKDPEIRHLQSGSISGNFSVACNETWTDKEGVKQSRVTWFNVSAYQQGEKGLVTSLIQPYLRKGQLVFIDADPTMRKWTDQQGNERVSFEIKLGPQSTIKMLGGRSESERAAAASSADPDGQGFDGRHRDPRPAAGAAGGFADDDIPF
jgi:single-strand DNA-binding protein